MELLRGFLGVSWMILGGGGRLLRPLGALLEASQAEKNDLERLLARPRRFPRQVSAIFGGHEVPEREAKRVQNCIQEAT